MEKLGQSLGREWGGSLKRIVDKPHFQLLDWSSTTAGIRKLYASPEEFMKTWPAAEEKTGWIRDAIGWWLRNEDGTYPKNQWRLIDHHWYLFNPDGYLCTGWHRWDGTACDPENGGGDWYFLDNTAGSPYEGACWHTRENGAQEIWHVE